MEKEISIAIFQSEDFGMIRTVTDESGIPLFCLADVCKALDLRASDVKRRLDDGVVSTHSVNDSLGRKNYLCFVNEDGLYDVILDSRKPEARAFRKWVTSEVLPQIRRTGGYIRVNADDDDASIMARALMIANRTIGQKDALLAQKQAQLDEQKPMVRFAEAVSSSEDSISIGELAKLIAQNGVSIGRTRLFRWMRENGYLFRHSREPMQKWVEAGLFEVQVSVVETEDGEFENLTTKVTGKGQEYFMRRFLGK